MPSRDPVSVVESVYGKTVKIVVRDMVERGEPVPLRAMAKWFQRDCRRETGVTLPLRLFEETIRVFRGMYRLAYR